MRMISKGAGLRGSIGASLQNLHDVLGLIAEGKLKPTLREIPFEDVEKALWSLDREVTGRLYTCPAKGSTAVKPNL